MNTLTLNIFPFLRNTKNSRGNTTTETAMLLLPFILLLIAVIEFGWYFLHDHTLQYATREGMRLALVGGVLQDENGDPLSRANSIKKQIKESAGGAMEILDSKITFEKSPFNNYNDPDEWTSAPNAGNPADFMRVEVEYDHEFVTPLIGKFFSADNKVVIKAQGAYRNELFDEEEV